MRRTSELHRASTPSPVASSPAPRSSILAIHLDPQHEATGELRAIGATPIEPPPAWIESLRDYLPGSSRAEFVATTLSWQRGLLDRVWLAVARDRVGRVALFAPATGDAFCPYGGGADVFVWGSDRRSKLGARFRAWVPAARTPAPERPSSGGRPDRQARLVPGDSGAPARPATPAAIWRCPLR